MRIQHNIMAMNAYRNYNNNTSALSKNLEKLSSGYKINRAGDDAAGLAISEKMRAQITGLETAQKNAKDGISLVQTAEGALTEVHDMLNRMVELAGQSANGTFDNTTDRAQLQKEVVALKDEINRIADSANFNGIQLLDGSLDAAAKAKNFDVADAYGVINGAGKSATAAKTHTDELTFTKPGAGTATKAAAASADIVVSYRDQDGNLKNVKIHMDSYTTATDTAAFAAALAGNATLASMFSITAAGGKIEVKNKLAGKHSTSTVAGQANITAINIFAKDKDGNAVTNSTQLGAITAPSTKANSTGANSKFAAASEGATFTAGDFVVINGKTYTYKKGADGSDGVNFSTGAQLHKLLAKDGISWDKKANNGEFLKSGSNLTLQIGDTSDDFNQLNVAIKDVHTKSLGIDNLDISSQAGAKSSIDLIKSAINTVSDVRGTLGATQNRLDHTMNNLSVMTENIQDAESTIRDTDVADEMMAYTKNNILIQSAQAMLAQANQVPQGVLQLLQ